MDTIDYTAIAKVFPLSFIVTLSNAPEFVRNAVLDETFTSNSNDGVCLQAAIKLMDVAGYRRHSGVIDVNTCNGITRAAIVGKFVFVESF